jgi:hypothetical protein
MFRHISLLRWNPDATAAQRAAVPEALRALPNLIPTIRAYTLGEDVHETEGNYDLAIIADFDDKAGYIVYRDNPDHQRMIAELIRPILDSRAAVQHEL